MSSIDAEPIVSVSERFPLDGFTAVESRDDSASPVGIRPWGLRRSCRAEFGKEVPAHRYDTERQLSVVPDGRPLIDLPLAGDPTALKTESVDGEDGPSSVDWIND
ncbi:putative ATP-grasp target RiPP [Actinoalloteichus hoggarensis]|uniref:Uncharacterized protein n=1 Tax=Actinoalloteichus hoggarensis TaxID=1470176 RepID=A0A221W9T1_9PSEU|nr:putative ATP-grasp-modified RiPP [Actinoalloteichus hoggarensis]ASO22752.1 hypothetical protein AHOG_25735 [Actinoalloteichus hoggarensis]MBB5924106.1 putative ATP-grasp target RiPP [Actinoalloteichus hoggarensis]